MLRKAGFFGRKRRSQPQEDRKSDLKTDEDDSAGEISKDWDGPVIDTTITSPVKGPPPGTGALGNTIDGTTQNGGGARARYATEDGEDETSMGDDRIKGGNANSEADALSVGEEDDGVMVDSVSNTVSDYVSNNTDNRCGGAEGSFSRERVPTPEDDMVSSRSKYEADEDAKNAAQASIVVLTNQKEEGRINCCGGGQRGEYDEEDEAKEDEEDAQSRGISTRGKWVEVNATVTRNKVPTLDDDGDDANAVDDRREKYGTLDDDSASRNKYHTLDDEDDEKRAERRYRSTR
jgi:hypothetical protein